MKKFYYLLVLFFGISSMQAQEFYVNFYGNYAFDDSFDSYYDYRAYYDGKIKGGFQWGAGLEYKPSQYMGFEFTYLRQDTNSPTRYRTYNSIKEEVANFDLDLNYLLIGGNRYFSRPGSQFQGYGGLMAGMAIANLYNPNNGRSSDATKFSWGAKLGGIYWMNDYFGIRMQAQLLSVVQGASGGFYFDVYGPQATVVTYSTFYQFSLGGGVVFSLN
ncbi:hypothetical protein JM658_04060 [Joostella atrarenae]|uniref:Outer membrane protein beta-barrel domain-containing protein n=1 Tax=Joostella atrarenae TaxID=679257 RepID=A0ABS9J0M6_9FLAO|nr:hypothetical protein [Joostella atrarenae]MCF8713994.1 hypothetical protein [Joostella atrarenae]